MKTLSQEVKEIFNTRGGASLTTALLHRKLLPNPKCPRNYFDFVDAVRAMGFSVEAREVEGLGLRSVVSHKVRESA